MSCGGDEGDRTLDLLDATEALSQLSYVPRTSEYISNHSYDVNGKIDIFFRPTPPTSIDFMLRAASVPVTRSVRLRSDQV